MVRRLPILLCVFAATTAGCKKNAGELKSDQSIERQVVETEDDSGHIIVEIDLNIDDVPDIRNTYRPRADGPRVLVKKELDLNFDGKYDLVSYMDEDGNLEKEEIDSDFDGQTDWTDYYKNGARVKSEYDTEQDGKMNVYKYFTTESGEPKLSRKERDSDGDGRIDVWEKFDESGNVSRAGTDTDGDGKLDEREE